MLDAFNYNNPDKIPVVYHASPAGLYVHGQKLLDLFNKYPSDNPIVFDSIPKPGTDCFDINGNYHETKTDEWGVNWEFRIFGIQGHPKTYPFNSWEDAITNYQFPPIPEIGSPEFKKELEQTIQEKKEFFVFKGWVSIFEKLHALRPFEEVLMDIVTEDEYFLAFLDRLVDYWEKMIDYYISIGADVFVFGDDLGMQQSTLISMESFNRIFKLHYQRLFKRVQDAGGLVFLHCCGYMGDLLDEFIEMGLRGLWPQLPLYDDKTFFLKLKDNKVATYIHPDRQSLIPLGTPEQIDDYIKFYADKLKGLGGGGIFYVEIENDAPFDNVKALIRAIDKYR